MFLKLLTKLRQEDYKFKASLSYRVSLKVTLGNLVNVYLKIQSERDTQGDSAAVVCLSRIPQ